MAIHRNENHFRREQEKILADNRARAQQHANDCTASRRRYRDEHAAAEFATRIERITTPPPRPRKEPPLLIPGHAAMVFVPDESTPSWALCAGFFPLSNKGGGSRIHFGGGTSSIDQSGSGPRQSVR
jgi:hypothetical protein